MAKRLIDANAYAFPGDLINEPTVDAVEVVRCKDCKYITPVEGGLPLCCQHNVAVAYNDFCSYGERKEG